ncbi:fas-associated protein [Holotrichia oblita]|uniref:Fas-associated protein n=1 Tax=Holotrichia oblita TaxID=644536 RepID=A0ACB9SMP8_HOLOL|nr:fas-associated protein [Holotrichia oblita]
MDYLGDNAGLGLTTEQTDKVLQFQDLTGIEDISVCRDVLQRHQWNLEVAVQEQLNIREGRPSVYATEARPPAVVSDHLTQHIFYTPPTDGSGSGLRGFIRSIFSLFWTVCYSTIFAIFRFGHRFLRGDNRGYITNPLEDVRSFIKAYEEKYSSVHPVFYQGTYSQVLNDAKRELKFLLVYLHKDDAVDTPLSAAVVVLRDGRMTIVSRMEGYCEAALFVQRLTNVVREFDVNLRQARQDRMAQNLNRSIRAHQDEAFLESLRADQEKDRQREEQKRRLEEEERQKESEALEEQRRKEQIARDKIDSRVKVPIEPEESHPDAIHLVIKLPCGVRINRRFLKTHSMEAIFYFVYCHPDGPDNFEITTNFPKRVLFSRSNYEYNNTLTIEQAGLKNRETLYINDLDA